MKARDELIRAFTGTEVSVILLKGKLEIAGITPTIRNDSFDSYLLTAPATIDLYVKQSDYKKAEPIISAFNKKNK